MEENIEISRNEIYIDKVEEMEEEEEAIFFSKTRHTKLGIYIKNNIPPFDWKIQRVYSILHF